MANDSRHAAAMAPFEAIPAIPGPPLIGQFLPMRRDALGLFDRVRSECGDVGRMTLLGRDVVVTSRPEAVHDVLVEHGDAFEKWPVLLTIMRATLGESVLVVGGQQHRRQRRIVQPLFQPGRIARYVDAMARHGEEAGAHWQDGGVVDVLDEMMQVTLRIVAETLFNAKVGDEALAIGHAYAEVQNWSVETFEAGVPVPTFVPIARNRRFKRATRYLDEMIERLVRERRSTGEDPGDVLSMLLAAREEDGSPLTDQRIRDEISTFYMAGHETTALALTWAWYLLGRHPEIFERLRSEIDAAIGDRPVTIADLPKMPFATQVLKEALRLFPPTYVLVRQAVRETEVAGHRVRPGTVVMADVRAMHRRPDVFPDPDRFDPDRFSPEREKQIPKGAYLPFGAGSRVCIGSHFALMEGQVLLATLVRQARLVPVDPDPAVPEPMVTLRPTRRIKARVERRPRPPL